MSDNQSINRIADEVKRICEPQSIILVSNKVNTEGELVSFKLVVIVPDSDESIADLECRLYMQIDSDIPYDLVLYKQSEWDQFKNDIGSFAWKIHNTGAYIYGEKL